MRLVVVDRPPFLVHLFITDQSLLAASDRKESVRTQSGLNSLPFVLINFTMKNLDKHWETSRPTKSRSRIRLVKTKIRH